MHGTLWNTQGCATGTRPLVCAKNTLPPCFNPHACAARSIFKKNKLNRGTKKNEADPVPLVLDLRIAHDRVGSSTDPTLNGHLRYPNNLDQSLNDTSADKIRKYRTDYNNRPPSVVSFIPAISSTSGRLHSEFVRLLFLQAHRETDRFLQLQEFCQCNQTVDSSTPSTWISVPKSKAKLVWLLLRRQFYVLRLI